MTGNVLASRYGVRGRFQRSTRLDVDLYDGAAIEGYILHATAWEVLKQVFEHATTTRQRAFTWTGPYGGGKSSLALLLASLVSPDPVFRKRARKVLGAAQARELDRLLPVRKGWVVVPVVGRREDPASLTREVLEKASSRRWPRRKPGALTKPLDPSDGNAVIGRLVAVGQEAAKRGDGLLVIIDEMGKLLEHAAAPDGDLHFFQDLAEAFARTDGTCLFIGILHQAFQEYAARLGPAARSEWAKIQGRFVDIPLAADLTEVIDLVGRAIDGPPPAPEIHEMCVAVSRVIKEGRLSNSGSLAKRLANCWPLHPVTALLLGPLSRRRFGQNERSTFSFLCSGEPAGFRDFLMSESLGSAAGYTPDRLWDYLQLNLEPAILASPDGNRWSEAAEAVERASRKGNALHIGLTKTIALLDLFGRPYGLKANPTLLEMCFASYSRRKVQKALRDLESWSVSLFRRHAGGWGVFAGSDIDLDEEVASARAQLGEGVAKLLPYLPAQPPVVAKRHYHQTGTLRWFDARILASSELGDALAKVVPTAAEAGAFVLVLPEKGDDIRSITQACASLSGEASDQRLPLAFGIPGQSQMLCDLALETAALERVRTALPALEGDAVARRELYGRLSAATAELNRVVREAFETATWYVAGKPIQLSGQGALSRLASDLSDQAYAKAPVLRNELVNRVKPSSTAVAARRVLMHQMVLNADSENLGIEGSPAELGIYLSLLRAAGLHRRDPSVSGAWRFGSPQKAELSQSFRAFWKDAEEFLTSAEAERLPVSALYKRWQEPPFGLRKGVMPILALALILAKEEELALYVDGVFTPAIDDLFVDRLLQNPAEVAIRRFRVAGVRRAVLQRLAKVVTDTCAAEKSITPLGIAKPIVRFAHRLHPWVKRTRRLGQDTMAVRDVLLKASDPYALLFADLPRACGISQDIREHAPKEVVDALVGRLREAATELRNAYDLMLEELANTVASALGLPDASRAVLEELSPRAERVAGASGDFRLDAFARRLQTAAFDPAWIEGVASLAANKPPRDWTDANLDSARVELLELASRFRRIERLVTVNGREPDTLCLSGVDGGVPWDIDLAVPVSRSEKDKVRKASKALRNALVHAGLNGDLRLAVVAHLLHQLHASQVQPSKHDDAEGTATKQLREIA